MPTDEQGILDGQPEVESVEEDTQVETEGTEESDSESGETTGFEEEVESEDEEQETDDSEEEEAVARVTSWTDIKSKYPNFAKDFPDVKNALFREQEYSNILGSPSEAKDLIEKAETFDKVSEDVVGSGNIVDLLDHVKKTKEDSYENIVYSILPYLQENDREAYYEIVARPIKQLLRAAWREGGGERTDLGKSAAHIHKFFFKDLNFDEKVRSEESGPSNHKTKREEELENRLTQIEKNKTNEFMTSVDESYVNRMNKAIREGLEKDERLTSYMKNKIVDDILKDIQGQLKKDSRYTGTLNSLIKQARSAGFTNDFKTRIINTALVRAKSLVPDTRKRVISEALRKEGKKVNGEERKITKSVPSKPSPTKSKPKGDKGPQTELDILRG